MSAQGNLVPFGAWTPDQPALNNPGATIARNVIPQLSSYRSMNSVESFTDALSDVVLGAFWLQDDSNQVFNFAGDIDKLYRLDSSITWTDISKPATPYGVDSWEFAKFGDRVIACGFQADTQFYDLGVSATFDDLAGSPPRARRVGVVRDFVVFGDTDVNGGGGGANVGPNYIQWSGFNNSELHTPSLATQSDFQRLPGRGGRVQRIVPGEYGVIFQEHSISRMDYAGLPAIFQIDELERGRGTPAPNSVAWVGERVFYYGWDHFYFFDGRVSTPISDNVVSNWFKANANAETLSSMRSAIDRRNSLVMWSFKSSASSVTNDRLMIYNWSNDRWSYAEVDTTLLVEMLSSSITLDGLDVPLPGGIDVDSIKVESDAFQGGALTINAFTSDNKLGTFSGDPLIGVVETTEISAPDRMQTMLNSVLPMVDGGSNNPNVTIQVGHRNSLAAANTYTVDRPVNRFNGEANIRKTSRYLRYRATISGGFEHAIGVVPVASYTAGRYG